MKALVGAFNQEKALVGAFSVIVKTGCGTDGSFCSKMSSRFHCNTPHLSLLHAFLTFGFLQLDLDLGGHDLVGALEGQHRVGQVQLQAE